MSAIECIFVCLFLANLLSFPGHQIWSVQISLLPLQADLGTGPSVIDTSKLHCHTDLVTIAVQMYFMIRLFLIAKCAHIEYEHMIPD